MKFKKIISKGLIVGLLLNNLGYSFANTKNLDERYETLEGDSITINNVLEEDKVDIEIEGNSLVNHIEGFFQLQGNIWSELDDKYILDSSNMPSNPNKGGLVWKVNGIKPNTTYSFIYKDEYGTYSNILETHPDTNAYITKTWYTNKSNKGINIIPFITKEELKSSEDRFKISSSEINATGIMSIGKDVMILEGDWTNKEVPEYFEGIKSVGELENSILNIESIGENLFDVEYFKEMIETHYDEGNYGYEIKDGRNTIWVINNHVRLMNKSVLKNDYKFKSNTRYILKGDVYLDESNPTNTCSLDIHAHYTDGDYKAGFFSEDRGVWKTTISRTDVNKTIEYIDFGYGSYASKAWFDLDSLYIGEYNPDKEDYNYNYNVQNLEIDLKEPLRALPNGVKDRVIKRNGQWVVERNCKEIILDGSENWTIDSLQSNGSNTKLYRMSNKDIEKGLENHVPISNNIPSIKPYDIDNSEGIIVNNNHLRIRLFNSKLDTQDLDGFKKWLKNKSTTVIYQLSEPIYEPLNIDPTVNLYSDTTCISNNSNIPANMKIRVDRTINKAIEAIKLAEENPTLENLSKARMWTNLLKESLNKDNLQNQISNITQMEDLTIEPKKVSSSLDIYVKSKNSLTMSLSTNSIIFDNFTGVDDMEKLNAVNITVNSSLPYQLNSYMMTELKNNDNTKVIPKELLNIRLNGETDYKAFADINEKLVLKEDCERGNNNQFNIDLILKGSLTHKADIYKTTIKFEAEQK